MLDPRKELRHIDEPDEKEGASIRKSIEKSVGSGSDSASRDRSRKAQLLAQREIELRRGTVTRSIDGSGPLVLLSAATDWQSGSQASSRAGLSYEEE